MGAVFGDIRLQIKSGYGYLWNNNTQINPSIIRQWKVIYTKPIKERYLLIDDNPNIGENPTMTDNPNKEMAVTHSDVMETIHHRLLSLRIYANKVGIQRDAENKKIPDIKTMRNDLSATPILSELIPSWKIDT